MSSEGYSYEYSICQGSFGPIGKYRDSTDGKSVAIKIGVDTTEDEADFELNKARLAASFAFPGLVHYYNIMLHNGQPIFVMRMASMNVIDHYKIYLQGSKILDYFIQIAAVLDAINSAGYAHAGLSPNDILIDDKVAMLTDFSHLQRITERVVLPKRISGLTRGCMSPEILAGSASNTSDQFSLCVSYILVVSGLVDAVFSIDHVRRYAASLHSRSAAVIMRALSEQPNSRYSSCMEFIINLASANIGD